MRPDAALWLQTARRHLMSAEVGQLDERHRCFHGQRAAELSVKAVLIHHGVPFPFTHEVDALMALVPGGVPEHVADADILTPYAVEEMYPDTFTDLSQDHVVEAVELARAVVAWAASIIEIDGAAAAQ